jgi:hypothetical protein
VEKEDDHEPGCPASKLAAGMGLRPASPAPLPPAASPEVVSVSQAPIRIPVAGAAAEFHAGPPPHTDLYLTVCALRI